MSTATATEPKKAEKTHRAPKTEKPAPVMFRDIKRRVTQLYEAHGHDIEHGEFKYLNLIVVEELKWVCEQLTKRGMETAPDDE